MGSIQKQKMETQGKEARCLTSSVLQVAFSLLLALEGSAIKTVRGMSLQCCHRCHGKQILP